jgi:hypothetical protein
VVTDWAGIEREIGLKAEIRHLRRMLAMAENTIEVQRRTSDRFWTMICDLVAGRGG